MRVFANTGGRRAAAVLSLLLALTGCATTPPSKPGDACAIFEEKRGWYRAAKKSQQRWGTPIHVQMAIMHQESRFIHDAQPPRRYLLGFIPWTRASSAYGYAQVKDEAWSDYRKQAGRWGASRDDFADAADFVGWYTHTTHRLLGVSKWDARQQYLAYHEGHGGFRRGSYRGKAWLQKVAAKVDTRARDYATQLKGCQKSLERGWWF